MFKINGTGRHFWINSGTLTPLLTWRCVDNITDVVLAGKTTTRPESGDQWFTQLVFSQDGEEVLNLEASEGAETIRAFGRHLNRAGDYHYEVMALSLKEDHAFKTGYEVKLGIGDVKMSIFFRPAAKFDARADRVKYFHLNLEFESSVPERATGIFAELAGTRELSHATRALLKTPPKAIALPQHSQCLCPPPAPPTIAKENNVVVDSFVVSGSVDDYSDADRDALKAEYANVMKVDPSIVALYLTAGSVRMTFYVCHGSTEQALETMADLAELVHEFQIDTGKTMVAESKPEVFIGSADLADVFCDCTGETCQTKTDAVHDEPLAAPPTAPLAAPPGAP
jgi:hypothetical protein